MQKARIINNQTVEELVELSKVKTNNSSKPDESEKEPALKQLLYELEKGEKSTLGRGTISLEDLKKELGE